MIDSAALQMVLDVLTGWLDRRERERVACLAAAPDVLADVLQGPLGVIAYTERFVRSIKAECLDRIIPLGERHFRRALTEFVEHYHRERNRQGLKNGLEHGSCYFVGGCGRVNLAVRVWTTHSDTCAGSRWRRSAR